MTRAGLLTAVLVRNPLRLDVLLEEIGAAFDSDGALLMTVAPGASVLQVSACWPTVSAQAEASLRLPVGYGVIGRVAANGQGAVLERDSPRDPVHRTLLGLVDGESVARLCVPLTGVPGEVIGVLGLHRSASRPFDEADLADGSVLAVTLGLRLAVERLGAQAEAGTTQRDELIAQAISAQEAERRRIAGVRPPGRRSPGRSARRAGWCSPPPRRPAARRSAADRR